MVAVEDLLRSLEVEVLLLAEIPGQVGESGQVVEAHMVLLVARVHLPQFLYLLFDNLLSFLRQRQLAQFVVHLLDLIRVLTLPKSTSCPALASRKGIRAVDFLEHVHYCLFLFLSIHLVIRVSPLDKIFDFLNFLIKLGVYKLCALLERVDFEHFLSLVLVLVLEDGCSHEKHLNGISPELVVFDL